MSFRFFSVHSCHRLNTLLLSRVDHTGPGMHTFFVCLWKREKCANRFHVPGWQTENDEEKDGDRTVRPHLRDSYSPACNIIVRDYAAA